MTMNVEALITFLKELQFNNNKAWFDENRPRYEMLRKAFYADVQTIIDSFEGYDPILRGLKPGDTVFRINKRFPDDQGPYKTHFSANFSTGKRGGGMPGYYFEIDQDGVLSVGGGLYQPTPEVLAAIREDIAQNATQIKAALNNPLLQNVFGGLDDMRQPKMPKGYSPDHPESDLLRQKGYVVFKSVDASEGQSDGLPQYVTEHFKAFYPLVLYLRRFGGE
jgi:uncharacterized protein (TIGR02453 family)